MKKRSGVISSFCSSSGYSNLSSINSLKQFFSSNRKDLNISYVNNYYPFLGVTPIKW